MASRKEYHCCTFRGSIERRRVPQVRFLNLGLGVDLSWCGFAMPTGLKRYYGRGDLHFITFSCYRRLALLGSARARNALVQALREVRLKYNFALVGYVVMPEHVHLLIGEPETGTPSTVVHSL